MKNIWIITLILVAYAAEAIAQDSEITITSPNDETSVGLRPLIKGTVTGHSATVWVVVHPVETEDFWVQPRVKVSPDGTWKVRIYIGRPGSEDIGKFFEVRAVKNPTKSLKKGDVLGGWPNAEVSSYVIELERE